MADQESLLTFCLDTFGDQAQLQTLRKDNDGTNDRGICSLSITQDPEPLVNDPNDHTSGLLVLFTEDPAAWPQAGEMATLTREGLAPGLYRGSGFCGTPAPNSTPGAAWIMGQLSEPISYEIRVGPEPQPTGSLMFGS